MKKIISVVLSLTMLATMLSGISVVSYADEVQGASIELMSTDVYLNIPFTYYVDLDGKAYNGVAIDSSKKEYPIVDGYVEAPAGVNLSLVVSESGQYTVTRQAVKSPKGNIDELVSNVAVDYEYKKYDGDEPVGDLTEEEYNSATNNGASSIVSEYVDTKGNVYSADEVATDSFANSINISGENPTTTVTYVKDSIEEHSFTYSIRATHVTEPPKTSFGKDSYKYTGSVGLSIDDEKLAETVNDKIVLNPRAGALQNSTAQTVAVTEIKALLASLDYSARQKIEEATGKVAMTKTDLATIIPDATALPTSDTQSFSSDSVVKYNYFTMLDERKVEYKKVLSTSTDYLLFSGVLKNDINSDLSYEFDTSTGELNIIGLGAIPDYTESAPEEKPWFGFKNYITSISISDGVTAVGKYAFDDCQNLVRVKMPSTVTTIGDNAFGYCSFLASVSIPSSVVSIGDNAFVGCKSVSKLVLPEGLTHIGDYAFSGTESLDNIIVPKTVSSIGDYAFTGSGITRVVLPKGVATLGKSIFDGCRNIADVYYDGTENEWSTESEAYAIVNTANIHYSSYEEGINIGDGRTHITVGTPVRVKVNDETDAELYFTPEKSGYYSFYSDGDCDSVANLYDSVDEFVEYGDDIDEDNYNFGFSVILKAGEEYMLSCGTYDEGDQEYDVYVVEGKLFDSETEHEHDYAKKVTAPTCTARGYTTYTCACGDTYVDDYVDMVAHTRADAVEENRVEPKCLEDGSHDMVVYCSVCKTELDRESSTLKMLGHDYKVTKQAKEPTCTEEGNEEEQTCTRCKDIIGGKTIEMLDHTFVNDITKATTTKNGVIVKKCSECELVNSTTTIYYPKTVTLSATSYVYDGKVKKPTVKVTDANGKVISASNYTVTYSSGLKNIGKYTVKVTFKGNYSGAISKTFNIVPKGTAISGLTAASKGFTVKWKKQATQTTGYQIQIATDAKFTKSAKLYTVSKNSTVSQKITKLTAKKKYYVRIRTYKKVGSTNFYSAWSGSKYITTKK